MQDNARPHVAGVCQQFLQDEGIDAMDWPARSPDLNPIEHIWDIMSRSIHLNARHVAPQTVQELADALVQKPLTTFNVEANYGFEASFMFWGIETMSPSRVGDSVEKLIGFTLFAKLNLSISITEIISLKLPRPNTFRPWAPLTVGKTMVSALSSSLKLSASAPVYDSTLPWSGSFVAGGEPTLSANLLALRDEVWPILGAKPKSRPCSTPRLSEPWVLVKNNKSCGGRSGSGVSVARTSGAQQQVPSLGRA
ncbi:hypothetical protein L3Q82_004467 [Scortum barcoo]|uniref:Uncharacterized protein n=1 Tax=Scortum barcoo TaxID=214431 RepID=A0ACB8VJW8_9TELE|nr:hypothetical protein L3Q82_004467 [Scortum barcoo]